MVNKINVLYEDNHLIVVEKIAGTLMQGANLNLPVLLDDVKDYLKIKYNKPGNVFLGLVHRLDTNVGGIVVFAKTSKAASRLSLEIREKRFVKKYLVIVEGQVNNNEEVILINYLNKDEVNKKAIITSKNNGKESILTYRKITSYNNLTLLDINLITGRFHQIRAQLANVGLTIYGDIKYGSENKVRDIALYAYYLSFKHPTREEVITITNLPKDKLFEKLLKGTDYERY